MTPEAGSSDARSYPHYITGLLLVVYICNQTDRSIFNVLMEPIKHSLALSDGELGFLAGPALSLLYTTLGVPVARWGDRSNRVNIMAGATLIWSCVIILFYFVAAFWHLALAQIGVGIGEAGFTAIAMSVIGDFYPDPRQRSRAFSAFMLAIPIGAVVSGLLAGWLNQLYGWRVVYLVAGVPGFALAALLKWTLVEPRRRDISPLIPGREVQPALRHVLAQIWRQKVFRHLAIAQCLASIASNVSSWFATYLIRDQGMSSGRAGSWSAIIFGIGGGGGIWISGYLISRFGAHDESFRMRAMAVATALVAPALMAALWSPSPFWACLLLLPCQALMYFFLTPALSSVQSLSSAGVRATMVSVFVLFQLLAGDIVGIQLLGLLSDGFTVLAGDSAKALRLSMALVGLTGVWAGAHFWWAARAFSSERAIR